ncbi:MAG: LemA family protein [Planctomycetota bacterium]|nr:LemA family protein [Planctomycetota bacterium]MDI6787668.1 LemA family protein [Planctomycetota bacterium]
MLLFIIGGAIGLVAIILLGLVIIYNGLVGLRNAVKNAWSQIDVQLKRRYDLIPNLVETVKGYAKHESTTFEKVTQARSACMQASAAGNVGELAKAEGFLTQALKSLFAVVEAYPELKANQNFLALQEELTSTENKISFARQFYNDNTMRFNNKIQMFPSNIVAGVFAFKIAEFFEITTAEERVAPKVQF